jgi:hypothetical protein
VRKLVVSAVALICLSAATGTAFAVKAANGGYHGTINGTVKNVCGGNENEGYFRVKNQGAKIVPLGNDNACGGPIFFSQILAPSDFECNPVNARLTATSIPIRNGGFDYTGNAPIGPQGKMRNVHFKGTWQTSKTVTGFTRITGGGCDSGKAMWKMKTPLPGAP